MKSKNANSLLIGLVFILIGNLTTIANNVKDSALTLSDRIKGWNLDGKPEIYAGEDLFLYINGGAEIYHEYGFRRVISGVYKNSASKTINAEIYEMKDSDAAYGIYSFKTSPGGKEISISGNQGKLQDYYLNIWKGKYKITLVGFDQKVDTVRGLLNIGKAIIKNLPGAKTSPPEMIRKLIINPPKPNHIKYIRGELGLFNIHQFTDTPLFNFEEGVVGFYDKYKMFIFKYVDKRERREFFLKLNNYFKGYKEVKFKKYQEGFLVIDGKKNTFFVYSKKKNIFIYLAKSHDVLLNIIKRRL